MVTGSVAFQHGTTRGQTSYTPGFMPLAVVPVKHRLLFETRGLFVEIITPRAGKSYKTQLLRNLNYMQLDYLANPHMTIIAGKFLTPFGTFNERLSTYWTSNFQDAPFSAGLGTNGSAGIGGEIKGSLFANHAVAVDYAAFVGSHVGGTQFKSLRGTGGRINFYFPSSGLEIGTSYSHLFEGAHPNAEGVHVWWEPHTVPFTYRSEYTHDTNAAGYWAEAGYRLARSTAGENTWLGRLQPLFRLQQTFRLHPDGTDGLPGVNTQRAEFGLNYNLPHETRILTSYARQFASTGNGNIWRTELTYRFAFPAWPGRAK